jgi:mono/diheme cytochrome c family protein
MGYIRGPNFIAASVLAAVLGGSVAAVAQAPPEVKTGPPRGFVGIEGAETFKAFCASCHGANATGNGPAAPALKTPVPDLTTMAKRSGTFDKLAVERVILGSDKMPPAHGTLTMPIWGPIFTSVGSQTTAMLRAKNLVDYLASIQAK